MSHNGLKTFYDCLRFYFSADLVAFTTGMQKSVEGPVSDILSRLRLERA